jgi:protein tyrosine phosphatase
MTPKSFILTQLPLNETVDDFWRMIVDEKCTSAVLLDSCHPSDRTCVRFYPAEVNTPTTYGKTNVTLESSRTHGQDSAIAVHELRVTGKKLPAPLTVHLYELTSWPVDQETPVNTDDILELIHLVAVREQLQDCSRHGDLEQQTQRPTTLMCLDGASRCGLYAAASYIVDKMKYDEDVDVFTSCRYIIAARPQAVTSQQQYEFLHRLALRALNWTPSVQMTKVDCSPVYDNINNTELVYANALDIAQSADGHNALYENFCSL